MRIYSDLETGFRGPPPDQTERVIQINVPGYHEMTFYPPYGEILVWRHKRLDAPGNAECTEVEGMLLTHIEQVEQERDQLKQDLHDAEAIGDFPEELRSRRHLKDQITQLERTGYCYIHKIEWDINEHGVICRECAIEKGLTEHDKAEGGTAETD